jgi:group I intron endonuclease
VFNIERLLQKIIINKQMKKNQKKNILKSVNLVAPLFKFLNAKLDKAQIFKENKGRAGIYRWINKVNNKQYIGSAMDLRARFYVYYSNKRLNSSKMIIYKALLKHGHANFILEILEYCEPNKLLEREDYYFKLLKPEYNILQKARSSHGYKHTHDTLDKMRDKKLNLSEEARKNISKAATGRKLSDETKVKISKGRLGIVLSDETRAKISAATTAIHGVAVMVKNIQTGETQEYSTMTEAAKALFVSRTTVKNILQSGKILRESHIITFKN